MKKFLFLLTLLTLLGAAAQAEELETHVLNNLTEVYGYEEADALAFAHEELADGAQAWYHPEHPEWKYTVRCAEDGLVSIESPFRVQGYLNTPGEGILRWQLYTARDLGWFAHWNAAARAEMQDHLEQRAEVSASTYLMAVLQDENSTAAQAIDALFDTCCGLSLGWPRAVTEWRDSVLAEYGLTAPERSLTAPGILRLQANNALEVAWQGQTPEELQSVFDRPELAGWTPLCGAYGVQGSFGFTPVNGDMGGDGRGLAAFEREDRRLLVAMLRRKGEWKLWPMGENLLYTGCDMAITHDTSIGFAITYALSEGETAIFHVYPRPYLVAGRPVLSCALMYYERYDTAAGQRFCLSPGVGSREWTMLQGPIAGPLTREPCKVRYPGYLGPTDIADFPTTAEAARAVEAMPAALQTGKLLISNSVHLRAKKSSHSTDLGTLYAGALLPVIAVEKGSEEPWIHTRLGQLEGYVTSSYTSYNEYFGVDEPLPVARASREISLKKGTSILDGTARVLPAGTRMHVVLQKGDWLYVAVPQGEIGWFMDVNSEYGYVRADDVSVAGTAAQLDWEK